jgi:hypothetical protein
MRGSLATIITCVIALEPAVMADPPDGERKSAALSEPQARATEPVSARVRAIQLTTQAQDAARGGDCPVVIRLDPEVRDLDRTYHAQAFAPDPAILACTGARPPSGPTTEAAGRSGPVLGSGVAVGGHGIAQAELRLGWMAHPQLAVFAAIASGAALADEGGYHLVELGARTGIDRLFVDLRVVRMTTPSGSDLDFPRMTTSRVAWSAGLGLDVVHLPHFGLELTGGFLGTTRETLFLAGLGFTFYP